MFCPECGKQINDSAAFCPNCGEHLAQPAQNNGSAPANPVSNRPAGQVNGPVGAPVNQAGSYQQPQQGYGQPQGAYQQGGYQQLPPNWESAPPFIDNFMMILTKKYFCFTGRASRKEYWYFTLATFIIVFIAAVLGALIGDDEGADILSGLVILALVLPSLGVSVRRLHDAGYAGWWILLASLFGGVGSIVVGCLNTKPFPNEYGPVPTYDPVTKQHYFQ